MAHGIRSDRVDLGRTGMVWFLAAGAFPGEALATEAFPGEALAAWVLAVALACRSLVAATDHTDGDLHHLRTKF